MHDITVRQAVDQWDLYRFRMLELGLVRSSTHANQSAIAERLIEGLGERTLSGLRKSHIELWIGERLKTCSPVTVRGELNVLRQILNWCIDEQLMVAKPRLPTLSVPSTEVALPPDEAFMWVLTAAPPQHAMALEFMMLTGLAPHELERVQARDVAIYKTLEIGMRSDFQVKQPSRRRTIPLNGRASSIWFQVAQGKRPDYPVFPTVAAMQKAIYRLRELAGDRAPPGVEQITPKLMRKWFASKVSNEKPEHVLQRLMGHAPGSPITRRHYVRSTDDQLADAVEGLKT
jgi:integrase